jgi:hypothetical protein
MGLGILNDNHLEHVPGTAHVLDGDRRRDVAQRVGLKYDASGKVLLVPQPSDDAGDPLVCKLNVIERVAHVKRKDSVGRGMV